MKYEGLSEDDKRICRISYQSVDLLRKFGNKSNLDWFQKIFNEDGERLWKSYVIDCNREIYYFQTYLTKEQLGDLYANIHFNDNLYIK